MILRLFLSVPFVCGMIVALTGPTSGIEGPTVLTPQEAVVMDSEDASHTQDSSATTRTTALRIPADRSRPRQTPELQPLEQAVKPASQYHAYVQDNVRDYTCTLTRRERVKGVLRPYEYLYVKCRNRQANNGEVSTPFSVYMKYLAPADLIGREVLYVEDQNGGDLLVRKGGRRNPYITVWLKPDGNLAMEENRYPITEFGLECLLRRLIEVAETELADAECQVKYYSGAKLDGRVCSGIEVVNPVRRDHYRFHLARILVDDELHVPVHYASYDWPEKPGDPLPLLEEYTYRDVKLNVNLSDLDFDRNHPDYLLRRK